MYKDRFKEIQDEISRMKLIRPGSKVVKKVIPVIAFDEASILSKNTFEFEVAAGCHERLCARFRYVSLTRRILNYYSGELDRCPFVFVGESAMNAGFGPSVREGNDYIKLRWSNGTRHKCDQIVGPYIHDDGIYKTTPH